MHGVDEGHHLLSSLVSIIQIWWLGTTILTHSDSEYAIQAVWVTDSNTSLRRFEHSHCDWLKPYNVVPLESRAAPKNGIWVNIVSFLNTIQTPICYVGCLSTVWWSQKYGHISSYTSGILLSWKTKNQFVFFRINLRTLTTFTCLGFQRAQYVAQSQ